MHFQNNAACCSRAQSCCDGHCREQRTLVPHAFGRFCFILVLPLFMARSNRTLSSSMTTREERPLPCYPTWNNFICCSCRGRESEWWRQIKCQCAFLLQSVGAGRDREGQFSAHLAVTQARDTRGRAHTHCLWPISAPRDDCGQRHSHMCICTDSRLL